MEIFEKALQEYLTNETSTIGKICKKFKIDKDNFIEFLHSKKYYNARERSKRKTTIALHDAAEFYIQCDITKNPMYEVSKKFGTKCETLSEYLKTYYTTQYKVDDTVFDNIDTEEKAYWLGFIFADGYISASPIEENKNTNYTFELSLKLSDLEHLKKAKEFFKFKRNILTDSYRCRLEINSKRLWEKLNNLGCTPRKSLTLEFPNINIFKDKSLIRHFIRGYWDGDGCLTYKRENYPTISVLGTFNFLENIKKYINCSTNNLYNNNNNPDCLTKVLKINGKKAFNVTKLLYSNCSIYLQRKYEKYLEYCRLFEESDRLLSSKIGEDCDVNPEVN